jgi:uncharacterized protein (TIGR00251 family)
VAFEARPKIVSFPVRLTPKGGRDAIEGWIEGPDGKRYLKARVSAPPEDGKANEALVRLIAKALGVGKTRVRIVSGIASRMKTIEAETESLPASWESPP